MSDRAHQLAFSEALGHALSDKRLEVLRLVADSGPISQAASDAGISHEAGWKAIETLSNLPVQARKLKSWTGCSAILISFGWLMTRSVSASISRD
jgi:molybdate transport system regulatory protein